MQEKTENSTTNEVLTTKEISRYLKLNEKTVLKLAQSGSIPGFKIANQWRFYLTAVDEYLQDKIVKSPSFDIGELIRQTNIMPLSRLTQADCIDLNIKASDKKEVLEELSDIASRSGVTDYKERLYDKLNEREMMLSTAIGKGYAVPHPRNPDNELFSVPRVIIARSVKGIDFNAPDRKRTHLFFMPCSPDVLLHLKLLSKISGLISKKDIFNGLMAADCPEAVIKILLRNERISSEVSKQNDN